MAAGFYGWVRNIAFYMIFMSLVLKLLPEGKNVKYIKYFMGMLLVLIVLAPAGRLFRLEEGIEELEEGFRMEGEREEFKEELSMMGEEYREQITGEYEKELSGQAAKALLEQGYSVSVTVRLCDDADSEAFGQVAYAEAEILNGAEDRGQIAIEKKEIRILDEDSGTSYLTEAEHEAVREALAKELGIEKEAVKVR